MKFSNRINTLTENPKFKVESNQSLNYGLEVKLNKLGETLFINFDTYKDKEILLSKATYSTSYKGGYIGVIEGFFSLIQGKPLEAIDRFPIKELDFFLRDNQAESAFTAYSQEIYEILAIGEKIKEVIFGKKDGSFHYDLKNQGHFENLSASEQYEIIEEFLSFYFYKTGVDLDDIECMEITDNSILFRSKPAHQHEISSRVANEITRNLSVKFIGS